MWSILQELKAKAPRPVLVARIGSSLGLKTGVYSSPHFERYTERFLLDNKEVPFDVLDPVLRRVLSIAESLDQEISSGSSDLNPATFFDISTATAFLLFAEQQVDLVALEVGLGGRLDSTNVCSARSTVITNISLDHTKQLGTTHEEIAAEKAGIIKSKAPTFCGPVDEGVFSVIQGRAQIHQSPVFRFGVDFGFDPESVKLQRRCISFDFWSTKPNRSVEKN